MTKAGVTRHVVVVTPPPGDGMFIVCLRHFLLVDLPPCRYLHQVTFANHECLTEKETRGTGKLRSAEKCCAVDE